MRTGTAAALAGGITMVLDMPNTSPPIIDAPALALKRQLAAEKALCDVGFFLGATGDNASRAALLASEAVGLKIYLDQTYGPLRMQELPYLLAHFQAWPVDRPIAVHAEGLSVAMAIGLGRSFGRRLHLCHISRADEMALIRAAKESGAALTCEVTPHHLFLTQSEAGALGPYGAMKPPLATKGDQAALWANLDIVDCIATDHAPHTHAEKEGDSPPPGVPGLETMLPLLLTAVAEGRLSLERLVDLTHDRPRRVFGLPAQPDTWVEVDHDARYDLSHSNLQTKCGWTPFEGIAVRGRVQRVALRGQTVFEDGRVLVQPGYGQVVEPVTSKSWLSQVAT
jgi:carbamoyl-phosphate synthase/aspartate carbamoyltransferase/dihydroorotase